MIHRERRSPMRFPELGTAEQKHHWSHADSFGIGEYEYIKSFVHREYTIGYHTHSFYELNIVFSGEGYHYIEDMPCYAKRGCVFLIPPYVRHGYINKEGLNVYHMLIHRDFMENCFTEFNSTEGYYLLFETEPYLRAHSGEELFLVLTEAELEGVMSDIGLISECKSIKNANIYINAIAKKLLCHLCLLITRHSGIETEGLQAKKEIISIADCLNYIHRNFDEKLTVVQLAKRLNMSKSTFIRQFEKICGCSPHRYIMDYRIKKAREYLDSGTKTATDIAQECGFYDVSHMRRYVLEETKL